MIRNAQETRSIFFSDLYALRQGQKAWRQGRNDWVTFEMINTRVLPESRGYLMLAGVGTALWWLEKLSCGEEEWEWLVDNGFDPNYATWLYEKSQNNPRFFTGDVSAIEEGTVLGAGVPVFQVTAPRIEAVIAESIVLSTNNHQTMVASKASRMVVAAKGRPLWDFSLRRLHGPEASLGVARAAYIAGFSGTATVEAASKLGIPTTGTMAHHEVMSEPRDREQTVFEDFLKEFPENHALLVDTYDAKEGIIRAVRASGETGIPLKAIRLDSGNLLELSRFARNYFDNSGRGETKIIASNDLDEYSIDDLVRAEAPIDSFGVGTRLGTVPDAPNVGGVYKLVEQHQRVPRYVMKLVEGKQTDPGKHQVWRKQRLDGSYKDIITLADEENPHVSIGPGGEVRDRRRGHVLLRPVMENGRRLPERPLDEIRERAKLTYHLRSIYDRDVPHMRLEDPEPPSVRRSQALWSLRAELGDREAESMLEGA